MTKLVVFGTGRISEVFSAHIESDATSVITAYACDVAYVNRPSFRGKPVVPFDEIGQFPPSEYMAFVALGYQELNRLRQRKLAEISSKGYSIFSYTPGQPVRDLHLGDNCFVCPGAHVEAGARLGDNVFVWDGALIGHHSLIGDNCWIAGGAAIGGTATVSSNCFIGLNATVGHETSIGESCVIGAGTLVTKDLSARRVVIRRDTDVHRLDSDQFLRFTRSI